MRRAVCSRPSARYVFARVFCKTSVYSSVAPWSKRSVERALEASGFEKISWAPLAADGAPDDTGESYEELVGVFTALLA